MKRIGLFLFILMFFGFNSKAQLVQITNEAFEGTLTGWTITPSASWKPDTNLYAGGHTSYHGEVPSSNQSGDTSILISPIYDLSSYAYVRLSFDQICKVSASDICQIEYREDYIGSSWQAIPFSSYQGNGIYTNASFSHQSYVDWQPGDSLAVPTNAWWKTESFNISDEASHSKVQFRFKITLGSVNGTYFVHGWLIDNFQINASVNPIVPPVVELMDNYGDTVYNVGPFVVKAKAATRTIAPLRIPKLYYSTTYGGVTMNDSISMIAIEGDSIWTATIPPYSFETAILFSVVAFDSVGNTNNATDSFYLKRAPAGGGVTGYVIVGDGTITNFMTPTNMFMGYSWTRMLYLSSEINTSSLGGLITKLAWSFNNDVGVIYNNQTCYFKAVDDTALVTGYLDPIADGATQVWAGKLNIAQGWVEITLNTPFVLPPGKNLHVYWHHENVSYWGNDSWNHTSTSPVYRTITVGDRNSFPSAKPGALDYNRPNARFYIVSGAVDSNAVALHSIDNPIKGTLSGSQAVKVTIKNKGMKQLDSCTINWTVNNVLQNSIVWRGHLPEEFNDTITLGYYNQRNSMYDTLVVWVSMPNGVIDSTTRDDSLSVVSYGCFASLNGEFIVGTDLGADMPSINEVLFIASLCGVSGDITLKLQNGTYVENWDFSNLTDLTGNYTLTITSLSGNRDSVILKPAFGAGIILNNTDNLIVKNITIDNTTSVNYGIQFTDAVNNIEIRNNNFIGNTIGTTEAVAPAPIYKGLSTGVANDVRFIGNAIEGGYYGIYFIGGTGTSAYGTNVVLDSNLIMNQSNYGTSFQYVDFTSTSYNTVLSRTANTSTTWYGLNFTLCNLIADGNKIHQRSTLITSPILANFYTVGSTTLSSVFSNNELIGYSTGAYCGFQAGSSYLNIVNNSIYMSGTGNSRSLYILNSTAANSNYDIKDNILVNTSSSGYPIFVVSTNTPITSDYNCLFGLANVGYLVKDYPALSSWQEATGQDANSINVNPSFTNVSNNLKLTNFKGFDCFRYPNVNSDIEGMPRIAYTLMGCYTAPLVNSNAGIVEILNLDMPANVGDTSMLKFVLFNAGLDTIKAATINWSVNNVLQPTVNWSGALPFQELDTFALGNIIYQGKQNEIIVWLSGIGLLTDTLHYNDTLSVTTYACSDSLSGSFIVGNNLGADASNISEAFYIASICGVKGNLTLKFQNGVYAENWDFSDLSDIMGSYTLTITSLSGKRDSVVLKPVSGVGILLNNTDNLVIKDITIDNTTNNNYGIQFIGATTNVEIRNNNFIGNTIGITAAASWAPIYKATTTGIANNIRFIGNTITGGYYGLYFYGGTSTAYAVRGTNCIVDSNIFINQAFSATYFQATNFNSVSYNKSSDRLTNSAATWYGLYFNYCNATLINANTIVSNNITTTTQYGMYCNYMDTSTISNNSIHLTHRKTTAYGLYVYYTKDVHVVHNTVFVEGSGATTHHGLYLYTASTTYNASIQNNICIATGATTSYPIYLSSLTGISNYAIDYNCYYGPINVGYAAGAKSTLAAFQLAVPTDQHSINLYPSFMDSTVNLKLNYDFPFSCPKYSNVDYDIEGIVRTDTTAIGAYEFEPTMDIATQAYVTPVNGAEFCLNNMLPIEVTLANVGNMTLNMSTNPLNVHVRISGAVSYQKDTIISTGTFSKQQTLNVEFSNAIPLIDTGVCYITAYISQIGNNTSNDTLMSNIRVNPTYNHTDTISICDNELPYSYGDSTFTTSGNHDVHFKTINGCDSLVALQLYVNPTYNHTDTISICDNKFPYSYGDSTFTTTGDYNVHFSSVNGCDSLVALQLDVNPTYNHTDTMNICEHELPYSYGDTTLAMAGNYDLYLSSVNGCDSTVRLTLNVFDCQGTDIVDICSTDLPYTYGDSVFPIGTISGIYKVVFKGHMGLDSIIILTLNVHNIYKHYDTVTVCANELPYRYGDSTFTTTGNYDVHFYSVYGCDSLVTLQLYVNLTYKHTDIITICNNELPYRYGDSTFTMGGSYNVHFKTINGCDSLIGLTLNVNPTYSNKAAITICANELPYRYGDSLFTKAGKYDVHFKTINGCDSLIGLTLNVNPTYSVKDTLTICSNQLPYRYGDSTLRLEGSYTVYFKTINGCDSVVALRLYVNPTYKHTDTLTICQNQLPYNYGGSSLTVAGSYNKHFTSVNGCDSLVTLRLYVNPSYSNRDTQTICSHQLPYRYGDSLFTTAGNYNVHFKTVKGCDSLIVLRLIVIPIYIHTDTITICDNELPYSYGDSTFTMAGNYNVHFSSVNGCDSFVALQLYVNLTYDHTDAITICDNEFPYSYGDSTFTTVGNYDVHFSSVNGCDSLVVLQLDVNPTYDHTDIITICDNELPYSYGDSVMTQEGDYIIYFHSILGCDSVINLRLNVVNGVPEAPFQVYGDAVITTTGTYAYYVDPVATANSYVWTISNSNWTGSSTTETIDVTISNAGSGTISVKAVNICGESDATSLQVLSSVNITTLEETKCVLGQNIPNPTSVTTKIPYTIPQDGMVVFNVMSINGQILYKEEVQASSGAHYLELNTQTLSNGIYYYSMEYQGQRIVKKMTIQK